jgi:hypothetical protein
MPILISGCRPLSNGEMAIQKAIFLYSAPAKISQVAHDKSVMVLENSAKSEISALNIISIFSVSNFR